MSRIRLVLALSAACAACLALAGSALASPTVARNSGWVPVAPPGYPNSDCSMIAQLVNDPSTGVVYSRGSASCTGNKLSVMVTEVIKATSPSGAVYTYPSVPTPLTTPLWVYSRSFSNGCYRWQGVTKVAITDRYNRVTNNYVTTGAPLKFNDHCPY